MGILSSLLHLPKRDSLLLRKLETDEQTFEERPNGAISSSQTWAMTSEMFNAMVSLAPLNFFGLNSSIRNEWIETFDGNSEFTYKSRTFK